MFVLLFRYVFGGAIQTPGYTYVDFLIPGIIVQTIAFGGFVTALGLNEDLHKGLIDRFRSLPMSRAAVLAGRTLADIATNTLSITVMLDHRRDHRLLLPHPASCTSSPGFALLLLFGYAFSWFFAFIGLSSPRPNPPTRSASSRSSRSPSSPPRSCPSTRCPPACRPSPKVNPFTIIVDAMRALWIGTPGRQLRLGRRRVVARDPGRLRAARGSEVPPHRRRLGHPSVVLTGVPDQTDSTAGT